MRQVITDDIGIVLARLSHGRLETEFGDFDIHVFHDGNEEAVVLSLGDIRGSSEILCRIHSECMCAHVFYSKECDCREQMEISQQWIVENQKGLIIYLRQEGKGNGAAAHVATLPLKRMNVPQNASYRKVGFREDARTYDIAVKILNFFRISSVTLVTSNMHKLEALKEAGVNVVSRYHAGQIIWLGKQREILVDNIKNKESEPPIQRCAGKRVFIIGDLNVDISIRDLMNRDFNKKRVGGTAFNAAIAFKETGCTPILFGKIGKDQDGELIASELRKTEIQSLLGTSSDKPTGVAYLYGSEIGPDGPKNSANDYDVVNLDQALVLAGVESGDVALLDGYIIYRLGDQHAASVVERVRSTGAFIIFDVVPHLIYKTIGLEEIKKVIKGKVDLLIGEHRTFAGLLGGRLASENVTSESVRVIMEEFDVRFLVLRYGVGNISSQEIWARTSPTTYVRHEKTTDTGYEDLPAEKHSGFGDRLTAQLIKRLIDEKEI